jgi:N-methylhydantoinase A
MRYIVGIDVGGTFTDCVLVGEDGSVLTDKSFSVPGNPGEGMVHALENVTGDRSITVDSVLSEARAVAIGTTSLTNKLITRGGAKVGLITTKGHEDAVLVGRVLAKTEGLSEAEKTDFLKWSKPEPIVSRHLFRGITERIDYKGKVIVALNRDEVAKAVDELVRDGVEAVAVSLLWSFLNPEHELWIQQFIEKRYPSIYVAIGSTVAPVLGEYERTNAAILSAHLGSAARRDMDTTKALLGSRGLSRPFLVMQSNGGCMWGEEVAIRPLNLIASGPVGGIIGAAKLGEQLGYRNIIATDMGGTSFDVGVIADGSPLLSDSAVHSRIKVALPHVEVISIGAGGGSIAWMDAATGILKVGPQSAGSVPGPVAYDQGGVEPTVTDADVILGRIDPDRFFNGRKKLNRAKAEAAIREKIAEPLRCDVFKAAKGMIDIVDSRMADLIRKLTVERGVDPRDFVLFAYGGAGATHVGAYAREVGIRTAVVSPYSSVFSALGIASSDIVRVYSQSNPLRSPFDIERINSLFSRLEQQASQDLAGRGLEAGPTTLSRFLDMRFGHQVHQVKVPAPDGELTSVDVDDIVQRFVALYEQSFGQGTAVTEAGVEILTFHVVSTTRHASLALNESALEGHDPSAARSGTRQVFFDDGFVETPIFEHGGLAPGNKISGPAIIEEANTTLPLHPGQEITVDGYRNLLLHFAEEPT